MRGNARGVAPSIGTYRGRRGAARRGAAVAVRVHKRLLAEEVPRFQLAQQHVAGRRLSRPARCPKTTTAAAAAVAVRPLEDIDDAGRDDVEAPLVCRRAGDVALAQDAVALLKDLPHHALADLLPLIRRQRAERRRRQQDLVHPHEPPRRGAGDAVVVVLHGATKKAYRSE